MEVGCYTGKYFVQYCKKINFCVCIQDSELERLNRTREADLTHTKQQDEMEISKVRQLSAIEVDKFENSVKAIGPDTIKAIANAGPQMQVQFQLFIN